MYIVIPDDIPNRKVAYGVFFDEGMATSYGNNKFGAKKFEAIPLENYFNELKIDFVDVHNIYEI